MQAIFIGANDRNAICDRSFDSYANLSATWSIRYLRVTIATCVSTDVLVTQ